MEVRQRAFPFPVWTKEDGGLRFTWKTNLGYLYNFDIIM